MSVIKKIALSQKMPTGDYTELCNIMERQGVFVACGNVEQKWVIGRWEDDLDFFAWCVAMGIAKISNMREGDE